MEDLKKEYFNICAKIIENFEKKQNITFDGWVGDTVGSIADFYEGFYFNFDDIIYDLFNDIKPSTIIDWYEESFLNQSININYYSYCNGVTFNDIKKINNYDDI